MTVLLAGSASFFILVSYLSFISLIRAGGPYQAVLCVCPSFPPKFPVPAAVPHNISLHVLCLEPFYLSGSIFTNAESVCPENMSVNTCGQSLGGMLGSPKW